jgi:cyclopropane fatty-acyl-phospholipid synthase-like methyltransferase
MMIYERGNAAKQWMLEELDRRFGQSPVSILDLACGDAGKWKAFLASHPQARVIGVDTDAAAIANGKKKYEGVSNIELRVSDAQHSIDTSSFDAAVAMSAIEHVVDRPAFLKTVWSALKPGGVAILNYDVGHFRSHHWKERLMVPVSQVLAMIGIEGPYMKRVDDRLFRSQAEATGFRITGIRKHNLHPLKGLMRDADDELLRAWFELEEKMGQAYTSEQLDRVMWSTIIILQKS